MCNSYATSKIPLYNVYLKSISASSLSVLWYSWTTLACFIRAGRPFRDEYLFNDGLGAKFVSDLLYITILFCLCINNWSRCGPALKVSGFPSSPPAGASSYFSLSFSSFYSSFFYSWPSFSSAFAWSITSCFSNFSFFAFYFWYSSYKNKIVSSSNWIYLLHLPHFN